MSQDYTDAQMAVHLMQAKCSRFAYEANPGTDDAEMTVYWDVSHNKTSEAASFLERFACGDNYVADPTAPTQLITDPVVSYEPYPGKWRVVRSWYDPQIPGRVLQTRRRGFLTTLLTNHKPPQVDWSEARVVSGRDHLVFLSPVAGQTDDFIVVQWRNIAPRSGAALAKQLVDRATTTLEPPTQPDWTPFDSSGSFGAGWRLLPPSWEVAQDGSESLSVAFVKLGVTETAYGNIGSEIETETITERVTEDQMQARVETLKATGLYSDVQPSRGGDGICQIRYTKLVPNPGVIYYKSTPELNQNEYHKIAWEQDEALLDWDGSGFTPGTFPTIPAAQLLRRVAGVRRNPQTQKWSYHVVLTDGGEQIPIYPAAALETYRSQFFERRMWSILNNMYWDQAQFIIWKHETLIFPSFSQANTWVGGDSFTGQFTWVDGNLFNAPQLPPLEGAAMPRLIGVNKWLAQKRTASYVSIWHPAEPT